MIRLAPSILAADLAHLGEQLAFAEAGGADLVHVDVMDGVFVPNLTFGPAVVQACRRATDLPLDVHLMMQRPEDWLDAFVDAGATTLTVHAEVSPHLHRSLQRIRELGATAGVAVNPLTPLSVVETALPEADLVLVMSVNPGFGGQRWIPASVDRLERVRAWRDELQPDCVIEVDGGITVDTAPLAARAGADVLVAGSAVFGGGDVPGDLVRLREAAGDLRPPPAP